MSKEWPVWSPKPLRSSWPKHHILGGAPYTPSVATDIRILFDAIRKAQEAARRERELREAEERYE